MDKTKPTTAIVPTTKRKGKNNAGRPTLMTAECIERLEQAFMLGCSDLEACLYAGINKATLYKYQTSHPKFVDRKAALKEMPAFLARATVIANVTTDPNIAFKYLERKKASEFGQKLKVSGDADEPIKIIVTKE